MYVIIRQEDGAFVAAPGSASSYTKSLQRARTFATREAAQRECCGNESPVAVDQILRPPSRAHA